MSFFSRSFCSVSIVSLKTSCTALHKSAKSCVIMTLSYSNLRSVLFPREMRNMYSSNEKSPMN